MFVRVVRFADVSTQRMDGLKERVGEDESGPEGVNMAGMKILHDADQSTAVVLQFYDSAEDMATAEAVFDAMDASDTPGQRASVDRCQVKLETLERGCAARGRARRQPFLRSVSRDGCTRLGSPGIFG